MRIADEVADALRGARAVVALESTIVTHGLPHPDGTDVARACEAAVRERGAVPATIAVLAGRPVVGVTAAELAALARSREVAKLSTRDLPAAAATGADGSTTVAATAHLAARAGIELFATGGLGGVHRGARESWDESADLTELARVRIAVVCAGVKSILDVSATLERLETLGVPVVGYRTRRFPGFYVTDSGHRLDWSVHDPGEAAALLRARDELGLGGRGVVLANPVPADEQLDPRLHDDLLAEGLAALGAAGVAGKDVTPFLLEHMARGSGGAAVAVNRRLVVGNAGVAADIAVALATPEGGRDGRGRAPLR